MPSILTSTLDTLDSSSSAAARNSSSSSRRSSFAPSRSRSFPFAPIEEEEVEVEGAKRAERGVEGREESNEEKPIAAGRGELLEKRRV